MSSRLVVSAADYPWEVVHSVDGSEHLAWYQRALVLGDFRPGLPPAGYYVIHAADGRAADPAVPPQCGTCGLVPRIEDLTPVDRTSRRTDLLDEFRAGRRPWPVPTKPDGCWWCNSRSPLVPSESVRLCARCDDDLKRGA